MVGVELPVRNRITNFLRPTVFRVALARLNQWREDQITFNRRMPIMTQAKSLDVSEMTIRMDAISPDAEQQLDELSWESQQAVLRHLFNRTIWRRDCKRVTKLSGNRVYRLRVTDSVRIAALRLFHLNFIVATNDCQSAVQ